MSILVVCPSCHARLNVSEKFAGKTGACPKCAAKITVPNPEDQVKIHEPAQFSGGGKNAAGQLVIKPISREPVRFSVKLAAIIGVAVVVVLLVAWLGGAIFRDPGMLGVLARGVGLIVITPFLVLGPYHVLRNQELGALFGRDLYQRTAICAGAYVAYWGIYLYVAQNILGSGPETWQFACVFGGLVLTGTFTALGSLELEFSGALMHYAFYLLVTLILGWLARVPMPWEGLT